MDTKLYDMDSPYTNLTSKCYSDYNCRQQRTHSNRKLLSCLYGLSVFICIVSCVVSCVCAFYCLRAASIALDVQSKLPNPVANIVDTPTAQALQDYESNGENFDDEKVLGEEISDEDESSYIDTYDDFGDYYDDDSEGDEVEESADLDDSTDSPIDTEYPLSDFVDDPYSGDDGYWSDDEENEREGSDGKVKPIQGHQRLRRDTNVTPETSKKNNNASEDKKQSQKGKKRRNKGKKQQKGKSRKARLRFLPAAQFNGSFDLKTLKGQIPEYDKDGTCVHVKELEGTQCNNRSFFPDNKNQHLKILRPEEWVTKKTSPVLVKDSVITVQSSGVHLLYAQVMFSGYEASKSASIVVSPGNGGDSNLRRLSCNADTNINNLKLDLVPEENLRTCSIFGMLHLSDGEVIELVSSNTNAAIERREGATYFGIVQLNKDK